MTTETATRDVVVVLITDVALRWFSEKDNGKVTVGDMTDRFLNLLDQHGYEIIRKGKRNEPDGHKQQGQ